MVLEAGLEPARTRREILSLLWLPITPLEHSGASRGTRTPNQRIMSPLL